MASAALVPGGMVGDPVDDDCHAPCVGVRHHLLEVFEGAELGIDRLVVLDAVRALYGFLDADLADGHEPNYVRSEVCDGVQAGVHGLEGLLGGEIPGIDLIHDHVLRGRDSDIGQLGRAGASCDGYEEIQYFFHVGACWRSPSTRSGKRCVPPS